MAQREPVGRIEASPPMDGQDITGLYRMALLSLLRDVKPPKAAPNTRDWARFWFATAGVMSSSTRLELLTRGAEQDFVHINLLGLAHGEGDCARERLGRDRDLRIELPDSLGGLRIGHGVRQFGSYRAR